MVALNGIAFEAVPVPLNVPVVATGPVHVTGIDTLLARAAAPVTSPVAVSIPDIDAAGALAVALLLAVLVDDAHAATPAASRAVAPSDVSVLMAFVWPGFLVFIVSPRSDVLRA